MLGPRTTSMASTAAGTNCISAKGNSDAATVPGIYLPTDTVTDGIECPPTNGMDRTAGPPPKTVMGALKKKIVL